MIESVITMTDIASHKSLSDSMSFIPLSAVEIAITPDKKNEK